MEWGKLTRKLSVAALALGLTAGTIPGAAFAAGSLQAQLSSKSISLTHNSPGTYISPKLNTKSSADVRVIVQLSGQPAAVGKYAAKQGNSALAKAASEASVNSQQAAVLDKARDEGLDLKVNYQYNTVLNGFEVTIPADEIPELAKISGVTSIYENSTWYTLPDEEFDETAEPPQNDMAPLNQIGATWALLNNYTGSGLKVGVIDTGVDYEHPDIKPVYQGGWDSFYNDDDPYEEPPVSVEQDVYGTGYEGTYHGTHVAGTIVGQYLNRAGEIAQLGVAPGAELYAYKVLGRNLDDPNTSSGSSAQVIDGIERAVKDHMDVINLSLGSDAEKDVNSPDSIAINNAVLSGVVAVIANGNAGPGYFTLGSPAVSPLAISVGAVSSPTKTFSNNLKVEIAGASATTATYSTYNEVRAMAWQLGNEDFKSIIGTAPVPVVYADLGDDEDYTTDDVNQAVVLVSRGDLTFVDKIAKARAHNARAVILFNGNVGADGNADLSEKIKDRDDYINIPLGDNYDYIPTFDLKGKEGRSLAKAILGNPGKPVQFTFDSDYHEGISAGDELASFTSWGPNVDSNLSIKPDIMAPGVGILSTWPAYGKYIKDASYAQAYNRSSGTSMATPHVAGLALLLKQAHPNWNPFDIRAALANTADVIGDGQYDVYMQGPGRANVEHAIKTQALLQSVEPITILDKNFNPQSITNYNPSASFGILAPGASAVKDLQLKNTGNQSLTYTASVDWFDDTPSDVSAVLDQTSVTASAYSTAAFKLNVNVDPKAELDSAYQGQIILQAEGQPDLHLPFVINIGKEYPDTGAGVQELSLSQKIIGPAHGQTAKLTFKLKAEDANYYEVDVVGLDDKPLGYFDAQTTGSLDKYFTPGTYTATIGAEYHPYNSDGDPVLDSQGKPAVAYLTDGIYKIQVLATTDLDNSKVPVKIDPYEDFFYTGYTSFRLDNTAVGGGGGGGGGALAPAAPAIPESAASLVDQGFKQVTVTPATTVQNGVTGITVSDSDLKAALANATADHNAVIISAPSVSGSAAKVSLTADQVKLLTGIPSGSKVIVSTKDAAVSLPVTLLSGAPAGAAFDLSIKPASEEAGTFTASAAGSSVIGAPVSFEGSWTTATGSTYLTVPSNTFIKRSFTVPGSIAANTAGVLFEENGKITPVSSVFKAQADGTTLVTVNRPGFSVYAAVSRPATFTDIAASLAASDITALANKLIFRGTSATTFSPKSNLTRAEFTALLARALGLRTDAPIAFTDVKASDWYASDIAAATKAGLILGVGGGKFAPKAHVSRQEVAVILDRAVKLAGIELTAAVPAFTSYSDSAKIASYAKDSVQSLSAAGIIGGDSGSVFNPAAPATRETIATTLRQLLVKAGLAE
ncbi:subtilisin family serine protease [Paenibacillus forsythiae]|uniref:Subtilisin family serine protease n=1 Tax=Paenibacillus forsythiae TaxID=365616 RepID=A0ABU3H964_9BACL|nr:S8 family serine peptidase [Paenibacillus forsythiae]MDT3427265.1 subtilisin family serine protease [Paenibacillus forsythiae]